MNIFKRLLTIIVLLTWVSVSSAQVNAAFFKFDQASYSVLVGDTFVVEVIVNPGSEQLTSVDAYITYGSDIVNVQSITEGSYFPTVLNNLTTGKVYIAGLVDSPSDFKTGTGTVATVTFEALTEGETELVFDCDGQATVTSKIIKNDINSTNIIECGQNGTATITVGVTATATDTTTADTPTPTRRPVTSLPASGSAENMMMLGALGAALVVVGGIAKLIRPF